MAKVTVPAENLRYLLWRNKIPRGEWVTALVSWGIRDEARARALLLGTEMLPLEIQAIAATLNLSEEDVAYSSPERDEILAGNINYLLHLAGHGAQKTVAEVLKVAENTVSRWRSGTQVPERKHVAALADYFRLQDGVDPGADSFFLTEAPVSDLGRREWLRRRVEGTDPDTLEALFPALKKLLDTDAKD